MQDDHSDVLVYAFIFCSLFPLTWKHRVVDPLRDITVDIYRVQTKDIVDARENVDEYLEMVSGSWP